MSFDAIDELARKEQRCQPLGPLRVEEALLYRLKEAAGNGHLFVFHRTLRNRAKITLRKGVQKLMEESVLEKEVYAALSRLIEKGKVIHDKPSHNIYLPQHYYTEKETAQAIAGLLAGKPGVPPGKRRKLRIWMVLYRQ